MAKLQQRMHDWFPSSHADLQDIEMAERSQRMGTTTGEPRRALESLLNTGIPSSPYWKVRSGAALKRANYNLTAECRRMNSCTPGSDLFLSSEK
jgi:hypothetical protein